MRSQFLFLVMNVGFSFWSYLFTEPEKEVIQPLHPVAVETKGPEITADPVTANVSGSSDVPASIQPSLPMINADFIQQFQNALHSIAGMSTKGRLV